jgi:hypothetical protein
MALTLLNFAFYQFVIRLAENDFIESHKGAEGLPILVRRGLHLKYLDSRKQADLDWPSFVDEV